MKIVQRWFVCLAMGIVVAACSNDEAAENSTNHLDRIVEDAWQWMLENDINAQVQNGVRDLTFPKQGWDDVTIAADFAAGILKRIEALDFSALPHEDQIEARVLASRMDVLVAERDYYWLKPSLTPYQFGFAVNGAHTVLRGFSFRESEDLDRYRRLLDGYEKFLADALIRAQGQTERSLAPAKIALPGIRSTTAGLRAAADALVPVSDDRLATLDVNRDRIVAFRGSVDYLLVEIRQRYDALLDFVDNELPDHAPDGVGLHQYEGGDAYYRHLVSLYTTTDWTPESLHDIGLDMVADLEVRMAALRETIGFDGSHREFLNHVRTDPRFLATSPEDLEQRYNAYIARIEPLIGAYFHRTPEAPYRVARLDPALEGAVTYGYYESPEPPGRVYGTYYYNASNLDERPLIVAPPLMYHELLPGHHFHIARQIESESLHPFRKIISLDASAYNEGWAEYAAGILGSEMGLYVDAYEEYGRLLMDMFFAVRITVDTGMNALGWPIEEAREFMSERLITSDAEVQTETIRYSTDLPGQALSYGIGSYRITQIRENMRRTLGEDFDVRDFHEAVLSVGAVPLDVLSDHVEWVAQQSR